VTGKAGYSSAVEQCRTKYVTLYGTTLVYKATKLQTYIHNI